MRVYQDVPEKRDLNKTKYAFSVAKINVGCGQKTKIKQVGQKTGATQQKKTHIARSIGPTVKKQIRIIKNIKDVKNEDTTTDATRRDRRDDYFDYFVKGLP